MKIFFIKFVIAMLTFIVGASTVYLSRNYFSLITDDSDKPVSLSVPSHVPNSPIKNFSDKIEIRFIRFVQNGSQTEAEFELTNNTAETAYYYSDDKGVYPHPKLKRHGKIVPDNRIRCLSQIGEHILLSGETVIYNVPKVEISYKATKNSLKETDEPTQIGFPFEIGEKRRNEMVWSEKIQFPK